MNNTFKNVLCLTVITIVAGFGLGYVYDITAEPIRRMEEATQMEAYRSVFPEAAVFEDKTAAGFRHILLNIFPVISFIPVLTVLKYGPEFRSLNRDRRKEQCTLFYPGQRPALDL